MNRWQKIAWYNIIIILVSLSLTAAVIGILALKYGMPKALSGLGALGTLGLLGLSPVLFGKKKGEVDYDERDQLIFYRSIQIAYAVFWPVFVAACMIPWFIAGPMNSIPSNTLLIVLGTVGITVTVVQSLATLVQYSWGGNKNE